MSVGENIQPCLYEFDLKQVIGGKRVRRSGSLVRRGTSIPMSVERTLDEDGDSEDRKTQNERIQDSLWNRFCTTDGLTMDWIFGEKEKNGELEREREMAIQRRDRDTEARG